MPDPAADYSTVKVISSGLIAYIPLFALLWTIYSFNKSTRLSALNNRRSVSIKFFEEWDSADMQISRERVEHLLIEPYSWQRANLSGDKDHLKKVLAFISRLSVAINTPGVLDAASLFSLAPQIRYISKESLLYNRGWRHEMSPSQKAALITILVTLKPKYASSFYNKIRLKAEYLYSGLRGLSGFDRKYYLREYQDVAKAKISPLNHYLNYGWREGRRPSEHGDIAAYLAQHPDVDAADINPLLHWNEIGRHEKRWPYLTPLAATAL